MGQELTKIHEIDYYVSPPGMIRHWSGGAFIHPKCGESNPDNDTPLVVHSDIHGNMQFRFVQFEGHWGYIEHVASGKVVHPYQGGVNPDDDTKLVVHGDRHAAALFTYDEDTHTIQHRSGKYIHPSGGGANPQNDTKLVLHTDVHDGMRWQTVTLQNEVTLLYPYPNVWGRWEMINCVINPKTEHTYKLKYTVGKEKTKSNTIRHAWSITAGAVAGGPGGAGAAAQYSGFVEKTNSDTFKEQKEVEIEIKIEPGKTLVTWQWVWGVSQWGDGWDLKSNILTDTESQDIVPDCFQIPEFLL